MAPLRRAAPPPLSRGESFREDGAFTQQAGRSTSSLQAEIASAALSPRLQSARFPDSPTSASSEKPSPTEKSSLVDTEPAPAATAPATSSSLSSTNINLSSVPPPKTQSPTGYFSKRLSGGSGSPDVSKSSNRSAPERGLLAATPSSSRLPGPPPRSGAFVVHQEMGEVNPPYVHQMTPMSVRDLGSDYTRYFNPFSDSNRSSMVSLPGTPAPRYGSSHGKSPLTPYDSAAASSTTRLLADIESSEKFSPFLDDRLAAPFSKEGGYKFPLYLDEKEDDDDMHMPMPDDDIKFKPTFRDHFGQGNLASTIGLVLMIVGMLFILVGLPVLAFHGVFRFGSGITPLDQMWNGFEPIEEWAIVNNNTYPLLENLRNGLIDPDTPESAMTRKGHLGDDLVLVFSDEFNQPNRSFYPGDDPYWHAQDLWYGATQDLEWYDPDAVTTWDGALEIRMDEFLSHNLLYRSGMLASWNQLCFKGGVFEVSVSLPGPAGVSGLWPGVWSMGNLGRPGYLATTDGMWPYTYDSCDAGITPNQSMVDGTSRLPGQRLPSCTCSGEDHPTPGRGRGAPEIDIIEASTNGKGLGVITQSFQVAPFDPWWYPNSDYMENPDYSVSYLNTWTGGPFQQALSTTTYLNKDWYDGNSYQKYAYEYVPGVGEDAWIAWSVGGQETFKIDGRSVGPNGNVNYRVVSEEPMSLVLNLGFSTSWSYIDYPNLRFPTVMRIDYVRLYQNPDSITVTCDPPGYETTEYIKNHMEAYTNPNLTHWNQTSYEWPRHELNSQC